MNLKKVLLAELVCSITFYTITVLYLSHSYLFWSSTLSNIAIFAFMFIYNQILYKKPKDGNDYNLNILNKTAKITGIIIGIPVLLIIMNIKNITLLPNKHYFHYWAYYFVSFFWFVHSIIGLILLKYYSCKKEAD